MSFWVLDWYRVSHDAAVEQVAGEVIVQAIGVPVVVDFRMEIKVIDLILAIRRRYHCLD